MIQIKVIELTKKTDSLSRNNKCFNALSVLLPSPNGPAFVDGKCSKVIISLVSGKMKIFHEDMKVTEEDIAPGIAYFDKNKTLYLLLR